MTFQRQIFFIGLLFLPILMYGQYAPIQAPLPQAPNNATLGRFGDYEVSLFTGVPNISIPLHTIKTNGFEVPITLSYHASGIKLYDYASWVGLGWALNAGGAIRRKLTGIPDEQALGFLYAEPRQANNIYSQTPGSGDVDYLKSLVQGYRDIGADIFSFNFPGGDGRFFFDPDNNYEPVMLPYNPVKIEKTHVSQQLTFRAFDIAGNQMTFGNNYAEQTHSVAVGGTASFQISAWMLEKMISATRKDTIHFTYQSQFDFTPAERSDTWFIDDKIENFQPYQVSNPGGDGCIASYPYEFNPGQHMENTLSLSEMYSYVNNEIKFADGRILFELDAGTRQDFGQSNTSKPLKNIKVYAKTGTTEILIKTIVFFHSYFMDGSDAASKRLRLDSLQIKGSNNAVVQTYRFEYNTTVSLPALTAGTMAKDYWGYYNGRSNTSLVPQIQITDYQPLVSSSASTVTIGSTNPVGREPDSVYMQASILKKIYFPTGGHTEFVYETNRYLKNSTVKLAGGLRIKEVKTYDGINTMPLLKYYRYGSSESGNGRSNFTGDFYFFNEEKPYEFWSYPCNYPITVGQPSKNAAKRRRLFFSSPTIGLENFDGAPVVYPEVAEYVSNGTSVNGKTVYRFRDSADVIDYIPYSSKPLLSTRHFSRGQLVLQQDYKLTASDQYQLVQEKRIGYNTAYPNFAKRGGLSVRQNIIRENLSDFEPSYTNADWFYIDYYIPTDDNYVTADTTIVFNNNDETKYITTVKSYVYGNVRHQQPVSISTVNSEGEQIVTEIRYPADYISGSNNLTSNALLDTMLKRHMQAYPIELWTRKPAAGLTLSGGLNLYKQESSGLLLLDKQKRLEIQTPVSNYQTGAVVSGILQSDSRYKTMLNFPVYEARGNISEVQKENDIKEVFLWGYKGQFPVARIVGSSAATINALVSQSVLDNPTNDYQLRVHLGGLRTSLPQAEVFVYTYQPGVGMTSQTDPNGRVTFYQYDFAGRLSLVKDNDGKVIRRICYTLTGLPENCDCVSTTATWVNTSTAVRCKKNGGNENTGQIEQEQVDTNPCSSTFNQLQWVVVSTNYTTCPLPCNSYTCYGENKKCVNGVCETGIRMNVGSDYDFEQNTWICYYRYEFSDGSMSPIYSEYSSGACYFM